MRSLNSVLILTAVVVFNGCASTGYQQYEGRSAMIVEGQGGTRETVDGVDLWGTGNPPRRYQVLGVTTIEDFDNPFGNSRIRSALARQVKAASGDGAIAIDSAGGGQVIGAALSPTGAMTPSVGFGKKSVRYEIVKYLDKAPG